MFPCLNWIKAFFESTNTSLSAAALPVAPSTRNTFRQDLQTLFSFCQKRGYCQSNEAVKTELPTDIDKPAGIFKTNEALALLTASGFDMLPYIAIGLFAGLRRSELQKLDWSEVDLESGHIEVTAAKAKTAKQRLVPISKNLAAWIDPLVALAGPVAPQGLRKRFESVLALVLGSPFGRKTRCGIAMAAIAWRSATMPPASALKWEIHRRWSSRITANW